MDPRRREKTFAELKVPCKKWDDLDTALAQAVVEVAKGPLKAKLLITARVSPALAVHCLAEQPFGTFINDVVSITVQHFLWTYTRWSAHTLAEIFKDSSAIGTTASWRFRSLQVTSFC